MGSLVESRRRHSLSASSIHLVLIFAVYTVCFGSYMLVNVPYWDDWVLIQSGADGLWNLFSQTGNRIAFFLSAPFALSAIPYTWSITNFLCWGGVACTIYQILRQTNWSPTEAFWAAALTAAAPFNQARFALVMIPYSISALFFCVAALFVVLSVRKSLIWLRLAAVFLLIVSFNIPSFLTLSWIMPLLIFYCHLDGKMGIGDIRRAVIAVFKHAEFLLLPFLYWAAKSIFMRPYGLYENYNSFTTDPVSAMQRSWYLLKMQIPDARLFFQSKLYGIEALVVAGLVVAGVLLVLVARSPRSEWRVQFSLQPRQLLSAGWVAVLFAACLMAIFPYAIVGVTPAFWGLWETRHQATLVLFVGCLIVAVLRLAAPKPVMSVLSAGFLFYFAFLGVSASRQLLTDVMDNNLIMASSEIAAIPDGTVVGVFERDLEYRIFNRHLQFYDASSMLNHGRGQGDLVVVSSLEDLDINTGNYPVPGSASMLERAVSICNFGVARPQYGFGGFQPNGQYAEVVVTAMKPMPGFFHALGLALGLVFDRQGRLAANADMLDIVVATRPAPEIAC